jgi:membrane fusion protein, macrolide-specific efflux system
LIHIACALPEHTRTVNEVERAMESARQAVRPKGDGGMARARAVIDRVREHRTALALLVALAIGAGAYYAWSAWAAAAEPAPRYTSAVVQRGDLEDAVTATGILQPRAFVDVGTQVSGQLRTLHVKVGDTVKAGELLAEIDPTVYSARLDATRAQLRTQQAQLADRQAQLALAEQQHRRQVNLMRENATTQDALDTAAASLRSARAQIDVLRAQIEQTRSSLRAEEANLGYTKIHAPMAGTIVSEHAKQGQTLNANQQAPIVVRIADLSKMTVQSQVSEADVSRLEVGMAVYFTTLGNPDRRWYGSLRQINPTPEVLNNVVLYNALFDVENTDGSLMTQMTAQVFFVTAEARNAVIVPLAALRPVAAATGERRGSRVTRGEAAAEGRTDGVRPPARTAESGVDPRTRFANARAMVRVVQPGGALDAREVEVGVVSRVSAQILSGLEPGEEIVTGTTAPVQSARAKGAASANPPRMQPRL